MRGFLEFCKKYQLAHLCALVLISIALALNYALFVFPNRFAPAGIDGLCTMVQDIFGISMGYLSFLVNLPLLILAYLFLKREFFVKTAVMVVAFSVVTVLFRYVDLSRFYFHTENGTSIVLAPLVAGVIRGVLYAFTLKLHASSGGIDVIAALIKRKKPYLRMMNIIFAINFGVAIISYFVYGMRMEPVICSILYFFVTSYTSNHLRDAWREAVRFEIITSDGEGVRQGISDRLHLPATIVDAHGAYSGTDRKMVICVVSKKAAPNVEALLREYPESVVFRSVVDR
jgi:uncharacterized membrane-anchored protein YitT (DUF2179 family)